jgi:LmbE family N-acetylglucosaminyl deacetylase
MKLAADLLQTMRTLPIADLDTIAPGTSLILAPHADDESLGCGGLIAMACLQGRPPIVVVVTDGVKSHPGSREFPPERLRNVREGELRAAVSILGLEQDRVRFLGLPDTAVPIRGYDYEKAVAEIVSLTEKYAVNTIFVTWPHDPHCDHESSAQLAADAARRCGVTLKYYPVWGWLLPPNLLLDAAHVNGHRLNVAAHVAIKREAVAAHASQYADLITDDPFGFRLPPKLLEVFDWPYEVFLSA